MFHDGYILALNQRVAVELEQRFVGIGIDIFVVDLLHIDNQYTGFTNIDGEANRQACLVPVAEGMRIRRQYGVGRTDG